MLGFWSKSIVEIGQRLSEGLNLILEREQEEKKHIGMTYISVRRSSLGVRVSVEKNCRVGTKMSRGLDLTLEREQRKRNMLG